MKILVTGGAGFIGSSVIRFLINETPHQVVNLDKLTYASNLESLSEISTNSHYSFEQVDICNSKEVRRVLNKHQPDVIMHLAAESHVDRSIDGPGEFVHTNIVGTYTLLEEARRYWLDLEKQKKQQFRFHHISTDEVYGSLGNKGFFIEETRYDPSSPYSASKASSDHLVRAWHRTFDLPVLVTNCSNNYGPYQFPEKLIPLMILNAIKGKPLPVYGNGEQVRDWLHVDDHARALYKVITEGRVGQTYNIGGHNEKTNLEVVETICELLEELVPDNRHSREGGNPDGFKGLISFVEDRPGHDLRYAIDASKIQSELGWGPQETFESGIRKTIEWYLANQPWWQHVLDGTYRGERLGLAQEK